MQPCIECSRRAPLFPLLAGGPAQRGGGGRQKAPAAASRVRWSSLRWNAWKTAGERGVSGGGGGGWGGGGAWACLICAPLLLFGARGFFKPPHPSEPERRVARPARFGAGVPSAAPRRAPRLVAQRRSCGGLQRRKWIPATASGSNFPLVE